MTIVTGILENSEVVMKSREPTTVTFSIAIIWNIPPDVAGIDEGKAPKGVVGRNSWGKNAYGGPAPPDREHRYFFKLCALDRMLDLPSSAGKPELQKAMEGHIVAQAQLVGRYDRKKH
jgi:hypothetical protein